MTSVRRSRYDFHLHTSRSDGVQPPAALYEQLRAAGLRAAAISDHDSLAAPLELRAAGLGGPDRPRGSGPRLIVGLEINAVPAADAPGELHILGYGLDPSAPGLGAALARQQALRRSRIEEMAARLRAAGMPVDEELARTLGPDVASAGRPHLARALIALGWATSVDDAFARILGPGGPAFVPRRGLSAREAVETIVGAGGLAVLAHTVDAPDRPALVAELEGWGLRGLEVYYGGLGRPYSAAQVARLARFAAARGLLATGGSDYHGDAMDYRTAHELTPPLPERAAAAFLAAVGA